MAEEMKQITVQVEFVVNVPKSTDSDRITTDFRGGRIVGFEVDGKQVAQGTDVSDFTTTKIFDEEIFDDEDTLDDE